MHSRVKTGKLSPQRLARLLHNYGAANTGQVLIGPKVGLDAAAVRVDKSVLIVASDPVTYAIHGIGSYAVHSGDLRPPWLHDGTPVQKKNLSTL